MLFISRSSVLLEIYFYRYEQNLFVLDAAWYTKWILPKNLKSLFSISRRAYNDQSIYAQTILPFVLEEHTLTRASMPKPYFRSCWKSIRCPEHPCLNHTSVRVPRAYGQQSIHAQTIIVLEEHMLTRAQKNNHFIPCRRKTRLRAL